MITVKELMSNQLYTLKPTDTVHQARQLMLDKHIRHVPILDNNGTFLGLITKHDVLALSVSELADIEPQERIEIESGIPLSEVMLTEVVVAQENTNLLEAARFMLEQKHGCLPVFKDETLTGILTEADFVKLAMHLMERLAM
ncbi:CBS domain-containing protein [Beggiatoa leptomitoformis]|uniref:CBS domain-containing protein n=1 Tax=Beggiatoa leptomitoformis TaxID=288004 RepID=A0A2N9YEK7_9GAMM|nr:CBS domain-containing protein [Beggiatoa leptomitoformis]ALG68764.1 CBS domain-containing protein [Beggiatoa leptomitoformis]AUI68876.1 CBS domain-containing protein [Beggiatoa leptomitoformis]